MRIQDIQIAARDGFQLAATLFQPDGGQSNGRFVQINSATGVQRSYYQSYATFLCEQGFTVLTFDYRGIGGSRPRSLRGFRGRMREWGEQDVAGVLDWVVREHAPEKLLLVAHSAGGQVVGITPGNDRITAMLAVAVQSGYWRYWPFPMRWVMAALWYAFMPALTAVFGYFPAKSLGLAEDLPTGVARDWACWCRNPEYLVTDGGEPDRELFRAFRAPIRCYSFDKDAFAPKGAVDFLMGCFVNAPIERFHLGPRDVGVRKLGHFDFFRRALREVFWQESADWLRQQ